MHMDTRPGHAAQLLVYESFGCPRMDMNFKKFQEKRQICLFMLMCGDARVLENLNAEDITMTEINGNQWTFSDFSKKHSIHSAVVLGHDQGASCIDRDA